MGVLAALTHNTRPTLHSCLRSGHVGIGSDIPEPRLSYMMTRPNDARRSQNSANGGTSHCASMG